MKKMIEKSDSTSAGDYSIVCSIKNVLYPGWEVQLFLAVTSDGGYRLESEKCVSGWFQEILILEEHWQYGP